MNAFADTTEIIGFGTQPELPEEMFEEEVRLYIPIAYVIQGTSDVQCHDIVERRDLRKVE